MDCGHILQNPLLLILANLDIRFCMKCLKSCIATFLALLPVPKFIHMDSKIAASRNHLLHKCLDFILQLADTWLLYLRYDVQCFRGPQYVSHRWRHMLLKQLLSQQCLPALVERHRLLPWPASHRILGMLPNMLSPDHVNHTCSRQTQRPVDPWDLEA